MSVTSLAAAAVPLTYRPPLLQKKKERNYNDVVNKMVYESEGEILLKRS
jgi:hypothetical protein